MTTITVLICTYNRPQLLKLTLESFLEDPVELPDELIVVNGGAEESDLIVASFQKKATFKVKLIKTINKNLAASRNVGLPHCEGNIVAMTDDDARVFPDWIKQMKRVHSDHPEAGAVGGIVIGSNTDSIVGKVADLITFPNWSKPCSVRTLPGVNISYKREVLEKIGFQDETLFRGEDVDFNWRVLKAGYEVYFDPSIKVYHYHRPTLSSFLYQHYMYGRAYFYVRHKWPDMYCVYPHHIKGIKDMFKILNFFLSIVYQPFLHLKKIHSWIDRAKAFPLLLVSGLLWKTGMMIEKIRNTQYKMTRRINSKFVEK